MFSPFNGIFRLLFTLYTVYKDISEFDSNISWITEFFIKFTLIEKCICPIQWYILNIKI